MPRALPERTGYYFAQFVAAANKDVLHPLDWRRFYHFIHAAHQGRAKLSSHEVESLLVERGFSVSQAACLSNIYHHGRELLTWRPAFNYDYRP